MKLDIIFGSASDYPSLASEIDWLRKAFPDVEIKINILSCHRHPKRLQNFAKNYQITDPKQVILGCGSMAFAQPGVLKAWLNYYRKKVHVIGVALEGKESIDLEAAKLSVSRLPGKIVLMDEGDVPYVGPSGFRKACLRALNEELPEISFKEPPESHIGLTPEKAARLFLKKQ